MENNILKDRTSLSLNPFKWDKGPLDQKFISRGQFLLAYEDIKKDVLELQQKYRPLHYSEKQDFVYADDFSPENGRYEEVMNDVKIIRTKYGLSPSFDQNIFYYIIHFDPLTRGRLDGEGTLYYAHEHWFPYRFPTTGEEIMAIPVYPETSIEDIKKFWSLIIKARRKFYNHHNKRVIPRKNLERDIEIFKLKQKGLKSKDISVEIKKLYPGAKVYYHDISRIIKRLKNLP